MSATNPTEKGALPMASISSPAVPFYAVASGLRGFRSDRLRVRVTRLEDGFAWVRTADLLDAGTPLTLDAGQIAPETPEMVCRHADGLVAFA